MAFYLSKIRLNGNTYNLKDAQARTDIDHLPEWSRQSTKPTYTAAEVRALPDTYIAPVTSVNGQTGAITLTIPDADDHKWNDVSLNKTNSVSQQDIYIPFIVSASATSASITPAVSGKSGVNAANRIAKYDNSGYLSSTTPSVNDNSTKVATTAYVDAAMSGITYPVTSVNSKTGDVTLTASDVGAVKSSSSGSTGFGSISNGNGAISMSESNAMTGSAEFTMNGPTVVLSSTKDLNNSSITLKTNSVNNIVLSEGTTTITGVITPTADTMAANKKYVDDAVANASSGGGITVTQTLTSGTKIGEVNSTALYAPAAYNDTALAARVTALEQTAWYRYYTGSSTPSNSMGNNGDLYFQTE